jgi:poly(A) polymerase
MPSPLSFDKFPQGAVWVVGGFIRDKLLGRPLTDMDLAVKGDPRKIMEPLGKFLKARPFVLNHERGTCRVVHSGGTVDVSRLQGRTIEDDLSKRDFTINAMALPWSHRLKGHWPGGGSDILDPLGGRHDLKQKLIRLVSPDVFKEDPLRLLRAFRLSAELNFCIDKKTLAVLRRDAPLIGQSAPERVRQELFKILATPKAGETLWALHRAGLLTLLFPEGLAMGRTARVYYGSEGVLGHSLDAVVSLDKLLDELTVLFPDFHKPLRDHLDQPTAGYPRFVLLKLGEFLHDVGKPATVKKEGEKLHFYGHDRVGGKMVKEIGGRFRLSNDENRSLSLLVSAHMRPGNLGHVPVLTDRAIYRFYRDLGEDAVGLLIMALADHFTYLSEKERKSRKDSVFLVIYRMLKSYFLRPEKVVPPPLLNGRILMAKLKLSEGPSIGKLLNAILEAQAAGKIHTRDHALQWAQKLVKSKT